MRTLIILPPESELELSVPQVKDSPTFLKAFKKKFLPNLKNPLICSELKQVLYNDHSTSQENPALTL